MLPCGSGIVWAVLKAQKECVQKLEFNPNTVRPRFLIVNTQSQCKRADYKISGDSSPPFFFKTAWQVRTNVFIQSFIDWKALEKCTLRVTDINHCLDISKKDKAACGFDMTEAILTDVWRECLLTVILQIIPNRKRL